MKKVLSNYTGNVLNKREMSSIKGGGCAVCSSGPNGGGACGSYTMSEADATSLARDLNAGNDGYTYKVDCPIA